MLGIPLLVASILRYRRGSLRGGLLLTGSLGYFLYGYAGMAFAGIDRQAMAARLSSRRDSVELAGADRL